jgi:predicted ATP-grasp superfamily ATP-dependent carboligase
VSATVLVTDGEQRAGLAVVRSLGRAGYRCLVGSKDGHSLAGASRFARRDIALPDPLLDPEAYVSAVESLIAAERVDLLIPITDPAVLALLPARKRLEPVRIPFPDIATFRSISDKAALLNAAAEVGIAIPAQGVATSRGSATDPEVTSIRFPCVIKPARSVGEFGGRRVKLGVEYAADAAELRRRLEALPEAAFPVLLQERITGPGLGLFVLRWDGETIAWFAHRRLREKPPSGGVSVYRESIAVDPELARRADLLLDRFGWNGVAMIEFKLDSATGTSDLMEINGRFWGSLQLAVDAGVDFPRLLAEAALGKHPSPVRDYRVGVRSRWWMGDVDVLLTRLLHSDQALSLPADAPGRIRAIADFLRLWWPGDVSEVQRWGDPAPGFRELRQWLRRS